MLPPEPWLPGGRHAALLISCERAEPVGDNDGAASGAILLWPEAPPDRGCMRVSQRGPERARYRSYCSSMRSTRCAGLA